LYWSNWSGECLQNTTNELGWSFLSSDRIDPEHNERPQKVVLKVRQDRCGRASCGNTGRDVDVHRRKPHRKGGKMHVKITRANRLRRETLRTLADLGVGRGNSAERNTSSTCVRPHETAPHFSKWLRQQLKSTFSLFTPRKAFPASLFHTGVSLVSHQHIISHRRGQHHVGSPRMTCEVPSEKYSTHHHHITLPCVNSHHWPEADCASSRWPRIALRPSVSHNDFTMDMLLPLQV